jgi:hypothetical protein
MEARLLRPTEAVKKVFSLFSPLKFLSYIHNQLESRRCHKANDKISKADCSELLQNCRGMASGKPVEIVQNSQIMMSPPLHVRAFGGS